MAVVTAGPGAGFTPDTPYEQVARWYGKGWTADPVTAESFAADGIRSVKGLTSQLVGLEGARVEVVDRYGDTRRFWVGRSTGWIPCHLEIARVDSHGGGAAWGEPYQSVRVVRWGR